MEVKECMSSAERRLLGLGFMQRELVGTSCAQTPIRILVNEEMG